MYSLWLASMAALLIVSITLLIGVIVLYVLLTYEGKVEKHAR